MEIKDVLKYYIGQPCQMINEDDYTVKFTLTAYNYNYYKEWHNDIKPILRRLSSITEEELTEIGKMWTWYENMQVSSEIHFDIRHEGNHKMVYDALITANEEMDDRMSPIAYFQAAHYLLSRGFWLWGDEAFETGLIIEKK